MVFVRNKFKKVFEFIVVMCMLLNIPRRPEYTNFIFKFP